MHKRFCLDLLLVAALSLPVRPALLARNRETDTIQTSAGDPALP